MSTSNYRRVPVSSQDSMGGSSQHSESNPVSAASSAAAASMNSPTTLSTEPDYHANTHNDDDDDDPRALVGRRSLSERFQDKLMALLWVLAAVGVGYWARVPSTLFHADTLANKSLLQIVAVLCGINTMLVLYLTMYLPKFKAIPADPAVWQVYCPRVIPTMTACGVGGFLVAIRATWPVWGFLAPAVLTMEFLGLLFALHFVPWT